MPHFDLHTAVFSRLDQPLYQAALGLGADNLVVCQLKRGFSLSLSLSLSCVLFDLLPDGLVRQRTSCCCGLAISAAYQLRRLLPAFCRSRRSC
ncbi:hypothetical protein PF003_g143 [Phytophthora fragariae]|nr:hypothetical protein PF003_g143 [Phytophthora fragariae]